MTATTNSAAFPSSVRLVVDEPLTEHHALAGAVGAEITRPPRAVDPPAGVRSLWTEGALLDHDADWFWRYGTESWACLCRWLTEVDGVLVHDPRAIETLRLVLEAPIRWLGVAVPCPPLESAPPAEPPPPQVWLMGGDFDECEHFAAILEACFAEAGLPCRRVEADSLPLRRSGAVAVRIDPRPSFGLDVAAAIAAGVPVVGPGQVAAQALLLPELEADVLYDPGLAYETALHLAHSPARRDWAVEQGRARLARHLSAEAVGYRLGAALRAHKPRRPTDRKEDLSCAS
jgi:hypothetical protein